MIFHPNNIKKAKTTLLGVVFLALGLAGFVDCWVEITGTCGIEAKSYIGAFVISGLAFLFLDYNEIKEYIKKLIDAAIKRFGGK